MALNYSCGLSSSASTRFYILFERWHRGETEAIRSFLQARVGSVEMAVAEFYRCGLSSY